MKVGLGIVTFQRPARYRQCAESISTHLLETDVVDEIVSWHDGPIDIADYGYVLNLHAHERNLGVGATKNSCLHYLLDLGCDWIFLCEDDMVIDSPAAVTGYIAAAEASGQRHLNFHAHGPANRVPMFTDGPITLWPNIVGSWSLYHRDDLNEVGLMDEAMHNAFEHCFAYETPILTAQGWQPIGSLAGSKPTVLTRNGNWTEAPVESFGRQPLLEVQLRRGKATLSLFATAGHQWFVTPSLASHRVSAGTISTTDLVGRYLPTLFGQGIRGRVAPSAFGIAAGIVFGDGHLDRKHSRVELHGDKRELVRFFPLSPTTEYRGLHISDLPQSFKAVPSLDESRSYLLGWLMGYFATDGSVSKTGGCSMASRTRAHMELVRDVCGLLGISASYLTTTDHSGGYKDGPAFSLRLKRGHLEPWFFLLGKHRERFEATPVQPDKYRNWAVEAVLPTSRLEEVFCATVPETSAFVIGGNILTHNCEHTARLMRAGACHRWPGVPDATGSEYWLHEQEGAIEDTSIPTAGRWEQQRAAILHWRKKDAASLRMIFPKHTIWELHETEPVNA